MINCIKLAGKDAGAPRGSWHVSLGVLAALFLPVLNSGAAFAIPAAEKLLPDDTLVMVTVPDFGKLREIYGKLPQSQLWNDAAMKPFKDKFLAKWKEEFVKPLERELQVRFDDYQGLLEGQLTFALVQNATAGKDEEPVGWLVLLDTQTKGRQLKNNLAELRKKWVDAGRTMRTEKIRGLDFSVLSLSSNDVPKTLRKLFPQTPAAQESGVEGESKKASSRDELVIGQGDSVLLAGSSTKGGEKGTRCARPVANNQGGSAFGRDRPGRCEDARFQRAELQRGPVFPALSGCSGSQPPGSAQAPGRGAQGAQSAPLCARRRRRIPALAARRPEGLGRL